MKDFVKTSDSAFAAYLMLKGYTCLDAVDDGEVSSSGLPRLNLYLTHEDEDVRANIFEHSNNLRDDFQNETKGYREYYIRLQTVRKKLREPMDSKTGKRKVFVFRAANGGNNV